MNLKYKISLKKLLCNVNSNWSTEHFHQWGKSKTWGRTSPITSTNKKPICRIDGSIYRQVKFLGRNTLWGPQALDHYIFLYTILFSVGRVYCSLTLFTSALQCLFCPCCWYVNFCIYPHVKMLESSGLFTLILLCIFIFSCSSVQRERLQKRERRKREKRTMLILGKNNDYNRFIASKVKETSSMNTLISDHVQCQSDIEPLFY